MRVSEYIRQASRIDDSEIREMLEKAGWQRSKKAEREWGDKELTIYLKKYGGIIIRALVSSNYFDTYVRLRPSVRATIRISNEQREQHKDQLIALLKKDDSTFTPQKVDQAAKEIAQLVKKLQAPPKKRTHERFRYKEEQGPSARKKWLADVERNILDILQGSYRSGRDLWTRAMTTADIVDDIVNNRNLDADQHLRVVHKEVHALLTSMARKKKIERVRPRDTGEKKTLWIWEP